MKFAHIIVVVTLLAPGVLAQQAVTPPATRILRGVVLTASDVPLPRVRVAVAGAPAGEPPVLTDERGQFTVRVADGESVRLTFTKARYAAVNVDMRRAELDAAATTGMRVRLSLGGAISGQVRDRSGVPVSRISVTARQAWPAAQSDSPVRAVTTNDLGEFRFGGLVAGVYTVSVRREIARGIPGPEPVSEQSVNVSLGAEVSGLDVTIDLLSELTDRNTVRKPPEANATGALRGQVVTARGVPIAGAIVQAYGQSGILSENVETDGRGRYVIQRLVPGEYRVEAFKRGYITPTPGQDRSAIDSLLASTPSGGRVVNVGRGQTVDSPDLILGRGASISGTIIDEFGEPMQDVPVFALQLRAMGGETRALRVSAEGTLGRTDDRGRYRLYGLQPGAYVVQATAGDVLSASSGYTSLFYPGTPSIDLATSTKLDIDQAVSGIDLALSPQPVRRIRGTLIDPGGNVPERGDVTLTARGRSGGIRTEPMRTSTDADGTFTFNNVAPGNYIVQASALARAESRAPVAYSQQFAETPVTIGGDDPAPLRLKLSRGATLAGHVLYEGITEPFPPYKGIQLIPVPAMVEHDALLTVNSSGFALLSDNTFEYRGVFGPSFLTVRPLNENWYVKSITHGGRELVDSAFDFGDSETFQDIEIVVSGAGAGVRGRVIDDRAAAVRDYTVALFPADRSKWTINSRWLKRARATRGDGTFRVTGLVPGDYWVIAIDRLDGSDIAGELQNPDVLDALAARAQRIALGEGQSQALTLRLVRR